MKSLIILVILTSLVACRKAEPEKAKEAGKPEGLSVSHWTAKSELFMEYPVLVAGETSRFAVHFTRLDNFKPVRDGVVEVLLEGSAGVQKFSTTGPSRPGIFGVDVKPAGSGSYKMTVQIQSREVADSHALGTITVYSDQASASRHPVEAKTEETIAFLKEQQWALDFATELIAERNMRSGIDVPAEIQPRAGGKGEVTAALDGRVVEARAVAVGQAVAKGEILVRIAPPTSLPADRATLDLAKSEAETAVAFATRDRERAQRLVEAGAAPARRLEEARLQETTAQARLKAAETRLAQYETTREAEGRSGTNLFALRAPIAGTVVEAHAVPGANVRAGDLLYRLVDTERAYVMASVPESDLSRLGQVSAAELLVRGSAAASTTKPLGRMISRSRMIDPQSRTTTVFYELNTMDSSLTMGQAVTVRLFLSASASKPAVPESSIIDDAGRPVVFVQLTGEAFARRPVTLGSRQAGYVHVVEGVKAGERVVTKGAYLIRLAAMSSQIPAHGHVH